MAQRTKNAIRQSFMKLLAERPFDKITIGDIAQRSEITRNAFYYYYQDIYALVEDIFALELERFAQQRPTTPGRTPSVPPSPSPWITAARCSTSTSPPAGRPWSATTARPSSPP